MATQTEIGTVILDGKVVTITNNQGITALSVLKTSGTVTIQGNLSLQADDGTIIESSAYELTDSAFETSQTLPIDGFIIDASEGICTITFCIG